MILLNSFMQTKADIDFLRRKVAYAGKDDKAGRDARRRTLFRLVMQAIVTLFCFGMGSVFVLSSTPSRDTQKLGTFLIGTGVGFWLR